MGPGIRLPKVIASRVCVCGGGVKEVEEVEEVEGVKQSGDSVDVCGGEKKIGALTMLSTQMNPPRNPVPMPTGFALPHNPR